MYQFEDKFPRVFELNSLENPQFDPKWDPLEGWEETDELRDYPISKDLEMFQRFSDKTRAFLNEEKLIVNDVGRDTVGVEVGDDRVDYNSSPLKLALSLILQEELFKMKTSWEDTFISNELMNFCEVETFVPRAPEESFDYARKDDFRNLGYVDNPAPRLILDVSKGIGDHSSSSVGKAQMLGTRLRTPRTCYKFVLELASYLQDGMLKTVSSKDPKYLPKIMGGSGCPALFSEEANIFLYVKAFKGGTYERIYGSAVQELDACLLSLEGNTPQEPVLCSRLRWKQEYLHATYDHMLAIPRRPNLEDSDSREIRPVIPSEMMDPTVKLFAQRLVRSRFLVDRKSASLEIEKTNRVKNLMLGDLSIETFDLCEKISSQKSRMLFDGALNSNAAFSNLLARKAREKDMYQLGKEGFLITGIGQREFKREHSRLIFNGKSKYFSIDELQMSDDYFVRSEVSTEESFKVGGIPLRNPESGNKTKFTVTRVGLYEISSTMEEWARNHTERMIGLRDSQLLTKENLLRQFHSDMEWVNDDTGIISLALADMTLLGQNHYYNSLVLFTEDIKLTKRMSEQLKLLVIRKSPRTLLRLFPGKVWNSKERLEVEDLDWGHEDLNDINPRFILGIYVDSGSLMAEASKYVTEESIVWKRRLIRAGSINGLRYADYSYSHIERPKSLVTYPRGQKKPYSLRKIPREDTRRTLQL